MELTEKQAYKIAQKIASGDDDVDLSQFSEKEIDMIRKFYLQFCNVRPM